MKNTFDIFYIMLNKFYCGILLYFHSKVTSGSIWSWFCYVVTGCFFLSLFERHCFGIWSSQDYSGIHERHHPLRQDPLSHHLLKIHLLNKIFFSFWFSGCWKKLGMTLMMREQRGNSYSSILPSFTLRFSESVGYKKRPISITIVWIKDKIRHPLLQYQMSNY